MYVKLQLEDGLFEIYEEMASRATGRGKQVPVEDIMVAQLQRFSRVHPMDRPLVVGAKSRQRMEGLLGGIFIGDERDLVERVEQVTDIQIQGVRVNFEPGQLANIKRYATKNGWTLEEAMRQIVGEMAGRFFDYVSA